MVDTALFQKRRPSRTYHWSEEKEDQLEVAIPRHRPRSYARTVRLGYDVINLMDEKRAWRSLGNKDEAKPDSAEPSTVAVIEGGFGVLLILVGLVALTLIAVGMRAIPLIISAYGIPAGLGMLYICLKSSSSTSESV